nr:Arp2:3 complex subunit [Hymenolepis microstoma]
MASRSATYEYCPRAGPIEGVEYPLTVNYCGECTMPIEYCEFSNDPAKCKAWLEKNLPDLFEQMSTGVEEKAEDGGAKKKSRQSRGGKGPGSKKPTEQKVTVSRASRGKNKFTTSVMGLDTYGIDLKVAAKFFGQKFATGSSANNTGEIVIQGDVKYELMEIIPQKWNQIPEGSILDLGDIKR